MSLLVVDHLRKSYRGFEAVKDVSFRLGAGEILAMIGPNGAGKTTCFNMIGGQIAPTSGGVEILGQRTQGLGPAAIGRIGVGRTFQVAATFGSMTVRENVQTALLAHRREVRLSLRWAGYAHVADARALLALVGLEAEEDRLAGAMAYGDVKRLDLAMALANDPKLLLMDEPTAGMAPSERRALMALTAGLARERGIGVLFTEHDMDAVFGYADRIIVLNRGEKIAEGTPAEVRVRADVRAVYLGEGLLHGAGL